MKKNKIIAAIIAVLLTLAASLPAFASDVSAESAILIEADSGNVIFEKNAHKRLPMASTTKIMTAVVALENCDCDKSVKIPPAACGVEGSSVYLTEGEKLTVTELLYAMLLESANDAATAIAIETAGSVEAFSDLMNAKAAELGLTDTHFTNPHGLYDENHYTTAADLAKITSYALANETFRTIVSTYKHTIPLHGDEGVRVLINHNRLLKMSPDVIGVKTGFTKKSGRCLVSAAEKDGVRIVAVTLNAPNDWNDHLSMIEEGLAAYKSYSLAEEGGFTLDIPAVYADDGCVTVTNADSLRLTLPAGSDITSVTEAPHIILTGVSDGESVGRVVFYSNGMEIGAVPLVACETTGKPEKKGIFEIISELFR